MKRVGVWMLAVSFCAMRAALGQDNHIDQVKEPAKAPEARPSENIALGATYTFDVAPDYEHCTDDGDKTQLTDGVYSEGYFWVQKTTVGWKGECPVIITLDLGAVKPIRGVSYNTAAGVAGVTWPMSLGVLVAGDDKQFYEVGDLVAFSGPRGLPNPEGYSTYRYWTDALETYGRYVALVIYGQPFNFVDEVEIYAGDPAWVGQARSGEPIADVKAHMSGLQVRNAVVRRLRLDIDALRKKLGGEGVSEVTRDAALAELAAVEKDIAGLAVPQDDSFKAILPLNPLHERIFRVQAQLWAAQGLSALTAWNADLWGCLALVADPPKGDAVRVEVSMMENEHRAGAFNLSNGSGEAMDLALAVRGLPGEANPPWVTVHEVAWTDTASGCPVASALPEAPLTDGTYRMRVPSGMTRQVWLTFHSKDIEPGIHEGRIEVNAGATQVVVPVRVTVYPCHFPDAPTLHMGGWDYTNGGGARDINPTNRPLVIQHLRERFVDSPWATSGVMPKGEHDASGAMTAAPSTASFDAWVDMWPDAARYCVFLAVGDKFQSWAVGTPEFDRAVGDWSRFWAGHAKERGIDPTQIMLLVVDEPSNQDQDRIILAWAKAIHAAETGMKIWEDPIYRDMDGALPEMIQECDVLCPNRPLFMTGGPKYWDFFAKQQANGIALEFYSCSGPARLLDPYAYYRLQAWTCWQCGADAMYFWAFGDNAGASSWNEYAAPRNLYAPSFLDAESVTPAKQMEACREGVEDFEYFVILGEVLAEAEEKAIEGAVVSNAERLFKETAGNVLEASGGGYDWSRELDRSQADKARVEILDAIVALRDLL
ncbi:MAG TPA: hypothetical protein PLO37_06910 [Candidatus Hydrogenedentes bacterium]|nr:hypothetical protein [Candidatus Hydrogenedentota bacterium]HPG66561.1 hypothetical protein [Candidatus Hydrogenedentota bacterium]